MGRERCRKNCFLLVSHLFSTCNSLSQSSQRFPIYLVSIQKYICKHTRTSIYLYIYICWVGQRGRPILKIVAISKLVILSSPPYIYEICLKRNGTRVINSLFQLQTAHYIISFSTSSPSSRMLFPILFCHASMHCWKDLSRMPFSSVVTNLLMAYTPSKRVFLMTFLSLWKKKLHGARSRE